MKHECWAELTGVSKRFGKIVALDGLDLQIHPGELFALLGQNGAGKTTAISLLLGGLGLPVFVLLELQWGLVAGGLADISGLLVALALTGMLAGILRFTGSIDSEREVQR